MKTPFSAVTTTVLALCLGSASAADFPSRPIRVIAPSAPGSPPDVVARIVSERLTVTLGQPVVIENRPGASGTIGLAAVASAPPDGHTVAVQALPYTVAPSLLSRIPYDTARDLAGVSQLVWSSNSLVVRADSKFQSVADIVSEAKANPGRLSSASGGNATPAHLALELFKLHIGVDIQHVPFKGTVSGLGAVLGGQTDMMFATTGVVMPHVRAGKLRALATVSPMRIAALPDVPTMVELGYRALDTRDWLGFVVPAATPHAIIARLANETKSALLHPSVIERLNTALYEPTPDSSPSKFDELIRSELVRWAKVVRDARIRAD